ncbi:unnamed protein product [Lymnaea stagnalis]|uniref:Dermatopontin n=1 Tax=Lymnaea stagnalis TaxID=6523 RepID=A0AAV2I342_LYMST
MYLNRNSWLLLVISFFVVVTGGVTWLTNSYSDWTLECPHGKVIKTLVSTFVGNKDRQWNFTCSDTAPRVNLTDCEWSGYINEFRTHLYFQCPNDGVISGVSTYFDSNQSDRRFKFLCCSPGDYVSHACVYTPVMNFNTMLLNVRVPDNWYLRGFNADYQYKLSAYDRLYYFNLCRLDRILPPPECVENTSGKNITEYNTTVNGI